MDTVNLGLLTRKCFEAVNDHVTHQENSKMLSHAYLYLFALVLKIRSFFSYLGLKFIR